MGPILCGRLCLGGYKIPRRLHRAGAWPVTAATDKYSPQRACGSLYENAFVKTREYVKHPQNIEAGRPIPIHQPSLSNCSITDETQDPGAFL